MRGSGGSVYEAGAGRDQVEAPGAARAQTILHQARRGWEQHVGRDGADDDGVDLASLNAALRQRALGRGDRHIRSCHAGLQNVPLPDAGALDNPLVVGLNQLFEVVIRHDPRGNVTSERRDFRLGQFD
jgi:hypothetical protein